MPSLPDSSAHLPASPSGLTASRRQFVQFGLAAAGVLAFLPRRGLAAELLQSGELPDLGRLRPRHARDITASPLSIGFETLDRYQFDPTRTYAHLGKLGVKWARAQTGWARCESEKGKYDFRWLDEIVDGLRAEGIEAWFNLGYGNQLYTKDAPDVSAVGFAPIFTPEARAGWIAFVDALAAHFATRVKKWEIWNEPNGKKFWRPQQPDAAGYVELVKLTAPVIRKRIPDATLIGLAQFGCKMEYTQKALAAGLADHVDRISFHPYGALPERCESYVAQVRQLLGPKYGQVKLWQGECGAASDPATESGTNKQGQKWNEELQAKWLLRRILTDLRLEIEVTSYFTTVDLTKYNWGDGKSNHAQSFGVLRGKDYSPKPSYFAYQTLCTLIDADSHLNSSLEVRPAAMDEHFRSVGFTRQGKALFAYWSATEILDQVAPKQTSLRLQTPAGSTIENPVMVDPLTQRVYALKGRAADGALTLADMPLRDYPLIIADRSIVPV
ncbi:beta-galactosidase [Opitutus sp. ER46]|uniref:GH39 family glycosyl hydrolase n=1 Tax=Opitutus sp. ER46 TaxID=2161864 RepID=UPI000D304E30|nr:beta-galactosidase [Opitutus sp. ER46]PTX94378.1 beta-glucosidase [Opitutus sp. ER46]